MEDQEARPEIQDISYGSALFRHIDRILSMSTRDTGNDDASSRAWLNTFASAIRMLVATIPSEIRSDEFNKTINNNDDSSGTFQERFEKLEIKFASCIDLLASKGYLYRKSAEGTYEN